MDDLPNNDILHSKSFHKAHSLTEGMLLEESGIVTSGSSKRIQVCSGCECELKLGRVPKQALANGMWIGKVPMELAMLTLPEKVLVAKCFPAAYIVKLFLKQKGAKTWASAGCNSGMRGNVSTYHLNVEDIANLVDPIVMPPSPAVLAATIGITIISPHNLPEQTMPGFLHVKQSWIKDALRWLKNNNPLWGNITISNEQLELYSDEDCVQETIKVIMKYLDKIEAVDREHAGYVIDDDDEEEKAENGYERNIAVGMSGKVWDHIRHFKLTSVQGVKDVDNEVDDPETLPDFVLEGVLK